MLAWDALPPETKPVLLTIWECGPTKFDAPAGARAALELGYVEAEQGWYYLTRAGVQLMLAAGHAPE